MLLPTNVRLIQEVLRYDGLVQDCSISNGDTAVLD